jgi:hypothetical protein
VCSNELTKVPSQKYKISTKYNRVYEIDDRKRYCSSDCYKASKYLESQIPTTPIWLRNTSDYLKTKTEIKIWPKNSDQNGLKHPESTVQFKDIEVELNNIENKWKTKYKIPPKNDKIQTEIETEKEKGKEIFKRRNVNEIKQQATAKSFIGERKGFNYEELHPKPTELVFMKAIFPEEVSKINDINEADNINKKKLFLFVEYIIERIMKLLTNETRKYLSTAKQIEQSEITKQRLRDEYIKKCDQMINDQAVEFNRLRNEVESDYKSSSCKPLPNYDQLKEEARINALRVEEFFFPNKKRNQSSDEDQSTTTTTTTTKKFEQNILFKNLKTNEEYIRVLPTVDSQSQIEIRRRIFHDKLIS